MAINNLCSFLNPLHSAANIEMNPGSKTIGPGHNTVLTIGQQNYILYHRIVPQKYTTCFAGTVLG